MTVERIGVVLCNCEAGAGREVSAGEILEEVRALKGVVWAEAVQDLCLDSEQEAVKGAVTSHGLEGMVVVACTPFLHRQLFRGAVAQAGMDPDNCLFVDAGKDREVSRVAEEVRARIGLLVSSAEEPTEARPVVKRALVIGGGAAGIQASLDIADGGYEVILVERSSTIGGHMLQLSETFPTLDCPQCIMTPKMVEINQHPHVRLMAYSEVEEVEGEVGQFRAKIRRKSAYIDWEKCTGCGECEKVCPVVLDSEWDRGVSKRRAAYRHFAQAVPNKYTIQKKGAPFCRAACPIHVNAQGYVQLISEGRFTEALKLIRHVLPFPGTLGRICVHPCEESCKRKDVDEAVSICALKRAALDFADDDTPDIEVAEERDEKVAIVGAGPAGLMAACDLRKLGYPVTVFDALPHLGGTLRVGIPEYRLPRDVLQEECSIVEKLGCEVRRGVQVGKDISLKEIKENHEAVFLAIGARKSLTLRASGEDLEGVFPGIDFLRAVNLGEPVSIGERVAVVGGGNTAVDAARSALRLGARQVSVVYRRSRAEMPAYDIEIEEALEEGISILYLTNPTEILGEGGKVVGMECIRTELGEPDASGRRTAIPITGSEFVLDVDMVIPAIGQAPESKALAEELGLRVGRNGTFVVDPVTLQTSVEGVFAGGDAVSGPASAVEALAAGRKAAISIDRYISGANLSMGREGEGPQQSDIEVDTEGVERKERIHVPTLRASERRTIFGEVQTGFTREQAIAEAKRCLSCADCCECLSCVEACEAEAVDHALEDRFEEVEVGAIVVATGYDLMAKGEVAEFAEDPDVLDGLQFERILCPSGPTDGVVKRPSDETIPKEVVFISCVGSRDPEHGFPYCSRVCCMYLVKMAMLYKHAVPDGQAYIFYMDQRTAGKGYEEFAQRAVEEDGVVYLRGRVSRLFRDGKKVVVWGADTLTGKRVEIAADVVVLGTAMIPDPGGRELVNRLRLRTNLHGFLTEAHAKLKPVETSVPGVFIAGTAQGPMDIPDTIAQASAAASRVLALFAQDHLIGRRAAGAW